MALQIGRLGFLGLGIEVTPGTPVSATTTIPYISNTIQGKHEPIKDISSRQSRAVNFNSVIGKRWSEGEVDVNVDALNIGFFLKLATGNEVVSNPSTNVYDHLFYTTTSGNTPLTATVYTNYGVDTQKFAGVTVDKMDFEVKDSLMTAKVGLKGFAPTAGAYTPVTVSGTLIPFGKYSMKFGSSLVAADAATATPVTEFMMSLNNNAETIFESGQTDVTRIFWKGLEITGSFTRYFETATDRDDYMNLNKRAMTLTASGTGLIGGNVEALTFDFAKIAYTDTVIETGLDDFFAVKTNFIAEFDPLQAKQFDATLRNFRSAVYS